MTIFANGMAKKWDRLVYVDLFAGPGVCVVEDTDDFYDGSPLDAMRHAFTNWIFVDLDASVLDALRTRATPLAAGHAITFIQGDCNSVIRDVLRAIPERSLTLAFLDPTNWQVTFDTVKSLVTGRAVDVILTFQGGMLKRVRHIATQPRVDAFFGTREWRPLVAGGGAPHLYDFCECYRKQMRTLAYEDRGTPLDPAMKNSTGAHLYHLLFFSRNERGHDFWSEVLAVGPTGQMNLFGGTAETERAVAQRSPRKGLRSKG